MSLNFQSWTINSLKNNEIKDFIKNSINYNKTYVLNKEQSNFSLIEKYIYDIANFHCNNNSFNINDIFIEFWFKQEINNSIGLNEFHVDCDEYKKRTNYNYIHPLLSCVTYFNNCNFPLLLTEIDIDSYKYKDFKHKNTIYISFPEEMKQVTFLGNTFHGVIDIFNESSNNKSFERIILAINLWDKYPENVEYFKYNNKNNNNIYNLNRDDSIINIIKNHDNIIIENTEKVFDYDFYNTMLYDKENFAIPTNIANIIKEKINSNISIYKNFSITDSNLETEINYLNKKTQIDNLNKHIQLTNNINNPKNNKFIVDNIYNRFLQRHIVNNIYSKNVCEWIIAEAEGYAKNNGGWTTNRHIKYPTTDLPVDKIKNIINFVFFSFNDIFLKIKNTYNLDNNIKFNITDLFIVKYEEGFQNELDIHTDGSFITVNILLSDKNDFEGGGTYFNDGTSCFLNQGDMIFHSGLIKHAGLPITKGKRYLLVAFTNIIVDITELQ